jgi:hypothetical protein
VGVVWPYNEPKVDNDNWKTPPDPFGGNPDGGLVSPPLPGGRVPPPSDEGGTNDE